MSKATPTRGEIVREIVSDVLIVAGFFAGGFGVWQLSVPGLAIYSGGGLMFLGWIVSRRA